MPADKTSRIIEDYYHRHPEEASKLGDSLLSEDRKARQQEAALNATAASGSPSPYKYYFEFRFLDNIGLSWWKWQLLLLGTDLVVYKLQLPYPIHFFIYIAMVAILIKRMA